MVPPNGSAISRSSALASPRSMYTFVARYPIARCTRHFRFLALGKNRRQVNKNRHLSSPTNCLMDLQRPKRQIRKPCRYSQSPSIVPLESHLPDTPEVRRPKKRPLQVSTAVPFPHTVRPKTVAPHSSRPYIRLHQLTAAKSGSPSPLQLKRSGNAVINGIVY
jgi:hypothetical protein